MATKTVHVCDICGNEAHTKRTIDVCTKHSVSGSERDGRKARKSAPKRSFPIMKCAICGKEVKEGAGYSAHMRSAHPEGGAKETSE
jgi:rRNA maturation endonuclease Nob1